MLCDTVALFLIMSTYKTQDFNPTILYLILFSIFVLKNIFYIVISILEPWNDDTEELEHTFQTPIATDRYLNNNARSNTVEIHEIEECQTPISNFSVLPKATLISRTNPLLTVSDDQLVFDNSNYFRFDRDDTIPVARALPTPTPTCSGYFVSDV